MYMTIRESNCVQGIWDNNGITYFQGIWDNGFYMHHRTGMILHHDHVVHDDDET